MTVVVTGAAGHVGTNLVPALLAEGRKVRALIRNDYRGLQGLKTELVRGDVLDYPSLLRAFEGAETVFHAAANISIMGDPDGMVHRVNVDGVRNVTEACLACGVKRLVHFSSIHAYDQAPLDEPLDETRTLVSNGKSPAYDRSKAKGVRVVEEAVARGLDAVIVHPTAVLGPGDVKPSRMGAVFLMFYHRRMPTLVEGGFDWVDVRDVVEGALAAEKRGRRGERYLLSGHYLTVGELFRVYSEVTGAPCPRITCPIGLAKIGAPFAEIWSKLTGGEPLYTRESLNALEANRDIRHDKAARELGYRPRPIKETVEAAYRDFLKNGFTTELYAS